MALEDQKQETNQAIVYALRQVQKRNLRLDQEREDARAMLDEMNAEVAREREETARRRRESAPWKGAITGAMSGAGMGSPFGGFGMALGGLLGGVAGGVMGAQDADMMYETAPFAAQLGGMGLQYAGQKQQQDFMDKRLKAWQELSARKPPLTAGLTGDPRTDITRGAMGQAAPSGTPGQISAPKPYPRHGSKWAHLGTSGQQLMEEFPNMPAYSKWRREQPGGGKGITDWDKALAAYTGK